MNRLPENPASDGPPVWGAVSRAIAERVAGLTGPETVAARLAQAREALTALRASAPIRDRKRIDAAARGLEVLEALLVEVSSPGADQVAGLRLEAFRRLSLVLAKKVEDRREGAQRGAAGPDHRSDPPQGAGQPPRTT